MAHISRATSILALYALLLSSWTMLTHSIPTEYCSTLNTASMAANLSIYQSDGLCFGFCQQRKAAFAVVQYQSCWCTNFAPDSSTNVATGECNTGCPGFGEENCGGSGLFGYLALGVAPSGTVDGPSQSTTQGQSSPSSTLQTLTADGTVKTVFVTPTVSATANSSTVSGSSKGGLGTGAVVGIVVGVIGFVVVAAGIFVCLYLARRKRRNDNADDTASRRGDSAGMAGGRPRREMDEAGSNGSPLGRQPSKLMPVDPRLDPFHAGIYTRNKSTESINTLRDDHDYSRRVHQPKVLRATNPDPQLDED